MPVVVVTGASHGIGRAIALSFASEDQARLVLVSRNEEKLADVADECARRGADTIVMPCDVTDVAAVNEVAEAVIDEWRSEEHTSELQSRGHLVCRLLLEKKKTERNHTQQD